MEPNTKGSRRAFAADLVTPRTALIFVAGFLLALVLARMIPSASLFHPEGQIIEKDIVITGLNPTAIPPQFVEAIVTDEGEGLDAPESVWDAELLRQAKEQGFGRPISLEAHIVYVVSPHAYRTLLLEPRRG